MSWGVLPWVYPVWDSLGFLDLCDFSFPILGKFFNYYQVFSHGLSFCLLLLGPYDSNVGAFHIVPEVSEVVLISFNSFFLSASFIYTILSSTSLILSSASIILLLVPSQVFFYLIYCIIHYIWTLFYFF